MRATSFKAFAAAGIVCGFLLLVAGASASTTTWAVASIGGPGFTPMGVNNAGAVAGYVGNWPTQQAAVWSNGTTTILPTPANVILSVADSINNSGMVVGTANFDDSSQEAVMWDTSGQMTELGLLPDSTFSSAHDINDTGQVVGIAGPGYQAVVWDNGPGSIKALQTPPDLPPFAFGSAEAINNSGQIVGNVANQAILWNTPSSEPTVLASLVEGASAGALDINNKGQVVGYGNSDAGGFSYHPVLWQSGTVTDFGAMGTWAIATAISDQGQIVGDWRNGFTGSNPFVIQGTVNTPLDLLSGDTESYANGINNSGQAIGVSGAYPNQQGVMWTHAKGPAELLADLGKAVQGIGPGTSLADKVKDAQAALAKNNVKRTCSILDDFISVVKAQTGKSITVTQATKLIADATTIKTLLGH